MTDKRWKALTVPYEKVASNDEETQCYRLSGKTVAMLLAMVEYMEWRTRWHKSDGSPLLESEIDNVKSWAAQAAYELMSPEPCFDESCAEGDCVAYYPTNPAFTFAPNDPFNPPETPPAGYLSNPLVAGYSSGIPGSDPNDVYCTIPTLLPAPPLGLIDQILNSGFPRVHFQFEGSGEVEVHLMEVAQGGLAVVRIDEVAYVNVIGLSALSLADIALSLEFLINLAMGIADWKLVNERTLEFLVPDGHHTLDILFIPNLSLNILETGWGGGLRSVVLCGQFTVDDCPASIIDPIGGGMSGFDLCWFDTEDGRILRYTINGGCTWVNVGSCDGGTVTVPPDVIIVDPIEVIGPYPIPEIDPANRALQRCRVLDGAFKWFMVSRVTAFISDVLEGMLAAAGSNIIVWLDGSTEDDPNYTSYYPRWKSLFEKHYPNRVGIASKWESDTTWGEVLECIVSDCLPENLDITREVMSCISDGIAESDYWSDADGEKFRSFLIDYVNSLPLSAIRNRVFRQAASDAEPTCGECTEESEPVGCGVYTPFQWAGVSLLDGLGWVSEIDGSPKAWAIDSADFYFTDQMTMMSRYEGGWFFNQNDNPNNPKYAGSIVYEWDEPFDFCELYARVTTETANSNTRMAVAWAQAESGLWVPLVGARRNIQQTGEVSLSYTGAPMSITRLKLVGTVGNKAFRFRDITVNGSMA